MKYTGWCENDFNVQGYGGPGAGEWLLVNPPCAGYAAHLPRFSLSAGVIETFRAGRVAERFVRLD